MRADCERRHQETLAAVRSMAAEQVPFNVQKVMLICIEARCEADHCRVSTSTTSARHFHRKFAYYSKKLVHSEKRRGRFSSASFYFHFRLLPTYPPQRNWLPVMHEGQIRTRWRVRPELVSPTEGPASLGTDYNDVNRVPPTGVGAGASCDHAHGSAQPMSRPATAAPQPDVVEVDPHILPAQEVPMVKPAWRTMQKRKLSKQHRQAESIYSAGGEIQPAEVLDGGHPTSWASWRREFSLGSFAVIHCSDNPSLSATTAQPSPPAEPVVITAVERTPGMWGPRSPRPISPRTSYAP